VTEENRFTVKLVVKNAHNFLLFPSEILENFWVSIYYPLILYPLRILQLT
jgi:hypothetical protein